MLQPRKILSLTAAVCLSFPIATWAQDSSFLIKKIKVAGLQRVTPSAVMHYLPIHVGQRLTDTNSIEVIKDLYNTGFFEDVQLNRQGNTLWIVVQERPTISQIDFSGNSSVTNKQLLKALHSTGITEGAFYNSSNLHTIVEGLKQLYSETGHNDAIINAHAKVLAKGRIGIDIRINEGGVAKVSRIRFEGDHVFSSRELMRQLKMHPTSILEFLSKANSYSSTGMDANAEALTNFYLDHGYLDFHIVSHQVEMTDDKKHVVITYVLSEGQPYTISHIAVDNHSRMASADIMKLLKVKAGDVFSRGKIIDSDTAVGNAFADRGYAFPQVTMQPTVDNNNHTVALVFVVAPGKPITVRYIHFSGNNVTEDQTLRHELTFMEGSPYAQSRLDESKRRFYNLPFIGHVDEKTVPVPNTSNQVDINYNVTEVQAGRAQIMGGYSDTDGWLYGVSWTDPNFKGQGKTVGINLQRSQLSDTVSFNYFNPFYTVHNVGRGFEIHYSDTNPKSTLNIASYDLDGFGGSINFSVPMSKYLTFSYGVGYDQQNVKNTLYTPYSIDHFINPNWKPNIANPPAAGSFKSPTYHTTKLVAGLDFSDTDRYYFPTKGMNTSFNLTGSVPVINPNLSYYMANFTSSWYLPLKKTGSWVLVLHTNDSIGRGYGKTKQFPFMYNFYSGGISTVPGFSDNTLGPRDWWGNALGGDTAVAFGADLVFPNPIGNTVRTSLTLDGGNVYNSFIEHNSGYNPSAPSKPSSSQGNEQAYSNSGPIRFSAGVRVQWQMPLLGTIAFAVARPLNKQPQDQTTWFNFSMGTSF